MTPINADSAPAVNLNRLFRRRGFCCVALDNPKTNLNVGAVLRAAGVYGANLVVVSGHRYRKAPTDTMRHHRHLPMLSVDDLREAVPYDCVPVAVEILDGATPLPNYEHPQRAYYVFGAEDATLGKRTLEWCRDVIYIPTCGPMNLAATVNVVLYDRMAKTANADLSDRRENNPPDKSRVHPCY